VLCPPAQHRRHLMLQGTRMAAMEHRLIGAKDAHPIGTSNPGQCKPAKLDQIPQTKACARDDDVAAGPVVVNKCKAGKLINHDSDIEGGQVAMNKAGTVQMPDLSAEGA